MEKQTIFQRINNLFKNSNSDRIFQPQQKEDSNDVLYKTSDYNDYQSKSLELKQEQFLAKQWRKASFDVSERGMFGLNEVKMMYRDADLMDTFPEIDAALDIVAEESTFIKNSGFMVNVTSKSDRIRAILQDLLVNRLSINITLPMICRSMCKYGNNFMLLNLSGADGILGWKQLPVYEIERYENGMTNPYIEAFRKTANGSEDGGTKFVWVGENEYIPYFNWQIAHFRLLYDSQFLPFGCSFLHKARRHFRMLSMMEDMMLIYRLERSIERRVFKINVGTINEADVPAYVNEVANNFKRTQIIDPKTGQLDLKKNILNVNEDYFIPVRSDSAPNPIETLQGAQNMTAMDDIKYIQNKVVTALRVPKSFLNYEESQGDGKNLSLLDVRFSRTVNRIQQALLMELNKICIVHLYLLGFHDELTNFSLSMNNPSAQVEMMELENLSKKIALAKDAVTEGGNGIPIYSVTKAWREILGWSDKEIEENLQQLRLEFALLNELQKTPEIIRRTKLFDKVDNIYGEPGADYSDGGQGGEEGPGGGGGGAPDGMSPADFGGGMSEDMGEIPEEGDEGEMTIEQSMEENGDNVGGVEDFGVEESVNRKKDEKLLVEAPSFDLSSYKKLLHESRNKDNDEVKNNAFVDYQNKDFILNEEINEMSKALKSFMSGEEEVKDFLSKNVE